MSKGMSKSTAIIQRLLEERRQYEAWIARLNSSADATPGNVRARVREDYEARLVAVMEELKAHAESARLAIQEKRYMRGELQKKEAHSVGEYDESQWEQVHQDVLAELVSVREDLQAVEADIQKLEELDALVRNRPTPRPAAAPAPTPPARPATPSIIIQEPPVPQEPPARPAQVDELEFIKSVTEDDTGAAPSPRRASGAQFQPTIPSDPPRAAAPPSQRAANPVPAPIVPDPSAAGDEEVERTLRCKQCGTMNLPSVARRRQAKLLGELSNNGRKSGLVSCRVIVMDQILSGGAIEQPRGHPIRRTRLLGRRGGAHALEGGSERGALSTVTYLAGAPLAHRLLRRLDSRHSRPPREARKIEGKCRSVKALRR